MADYTQTTFFAPKDALATGNPDKIILGSQVDSELSAISTAIATKYDSNDIASEVVAETLTSSTTLITPERLGNVLGNITLTAGNGLSGGGTIAANRSFDLALSELSIMSPVSPDDFVATVDSTDSSSRRCTIANLNGALTVADLSDVETGSFTVNWNQGATTTPVQEFYYTRIGNIVNIIVGLESTGSFENNGGAIRDLSNPIPTSLRPDSDQRMFIRILSGGSTDIGMIQMSSNGVIQLFPNVQAGNFPGSGPINFFGYQTFTYNIDTSPP